MPGDTDVVAVDTIWGKLQRLHAAPGVVTVGEIELAEMVDQGAVVVDCRTAGSFGGRTIPGSRHFAHDQLVERRDELDPDSISILFCNGPQCPQSPHVLRQLVEAGYPASALAYYRGGGMHDSVTLAMPTEPRHARLGDVGDADRASAGLTRRQRGCAQTGAPVPLRPGRRAGRRSRS